MALRQFPQGQGIRRRRGLGNSPFAGIHRRSCRQALDRLPEHYRQILIWREWDELPFADIGQRLAKSVDAARMLWWRALERFNQEMSKPV